MMLSDFNILLVARGLMFSPFITHEQAVAHIRTHPDFKYKDAAGV